MGGYNKMYICDVCNNPIEAGTQYVNVFDKYVCLDCAVRNTLDDIMATFGITYTEVPDEIVAEGVLVYDNTDSVATPEQVENFFNSENPVFVPTQVGEKMEKNAEYGMTALNPTQVGEKNTVLTTLATNTDIGSVNYKKAWVYGSASDAKYWAEHYLKNIPNLLSIDGFVSEEEISDIYDVYHLDSDVGENED